MKTYKKNKNKWCYNFVAELDNGKVINSLKIVTDYGLQYATEVYAITLERELDRFGADWFSFWLESKELEKRLGE